LAARAPLRPWPLHALSVNPPAAAALAAAAAGAGLSFLEVAKRPVRRHGDGYVLAELGADRLAALEGFLAGRRADAGGFGIVVASGTATTVDAVTTAGRHLGGLILPGPATALLSLHHAASLLPLVEPARGGAELLGHDTRSAMAGAVLAMAAGAAERVRASVEAGHGLQLAPGGLVVTGGWGRALAGELGAEYAEHLVLSGARVMVLGGRLPPP
jgi:type III pantothenate kinase